MDPERLALRVVHAGHADERRLAGPRGGHDVLDEESSSADPAISFGRGVRPSCIALAPLDLPRGLLACKPAGGLSRGNSQIN
jgi:hypothetical protein